MLADPGRAETTPNLFQYARRAGLATALFAGQAIKSWYYISPFDLDAIDRYRGCREERPEVPDHLIDDVLIDEVVGWIAERPRTFSYLLKMGAHFPYAEKHPADFRPFDAGRFASESDPRRRQKLTEYCLAMSWGCDRFLERLLTRLEGTDAIVVYTSDHGQSILEGGIEATHGVYRNPPRSQANVPIMIFATSEAARRRLDERGRVAVEANRDRASHFELFATFLELMGYDRAAVAPHYGSSLFAPLPLRKRRFFSGDPFQRQGRALNDFD
ncbi:MAG: sulfatase-like hydrolase/transferase [Planctomycetota bacterium]